MPDRIQLSRRKGWRMPENTVKVDRTTILGNPFIAGTHGTRLECVAGYALAALDGIILAAGGPSIEQQMAARTTLRTRAESLRGKNLACWCSLPKPGEPDLCHARVQLDYINQIPGTINHTQRILQAWLNRKNSPSRIYIGASAIEKAAAAKAANA